MAHRIWVPLLSEETQPRRAQLTPETRLRVSTVYHDRAQPEPRVDESRWKIGVWPAWPHTACGETALGFTRCNSHAHCVSSKSSPLLTASGGAFSSCLFPREGPLPHTPTASHRGSAGRHRAARGTSAARIPPVTGIDGAAHFSGSMIGDRFVYCLLISSKGSRCWWVMSGYLITFPLNLRGGLIHFGRSVIVATTRDRINILLNSQTQ